ncbi:MAG: hypothetical protein C4547_08925 [Phycisphaerales bacterium]|nr:MAG: hypothetical protein C4547_08925 [Phycisphaerales bacterium]
MNRDESLRWMIDEHHRVDELMRSLRERVAGVPTYHLEHWIPELRSHFDAFRAHMHKHMALEERDGYLAPVVEKRPTLTPEVERLQHEHREFGQLLDGIHRELSILRSEDRLLVRDCCNRINDLLSYIAHHEKDENMLIMFVFTQDMGTKD